jgi:hypothetical protein
MENDAENYTPDLLLDGYTAVTSRFNPQEAEAYHVSLLKRERNLFQWNIDDTGAFWAAPPPEQVTDQDWVIDYAVRDAGPVIPQKIWAPKKSSDRVRRVDHEQLHPPIFFIHENGRDLCLPLIDAAEGRRMYLRDAQQTARVGPSAHAQIRINVSFNFIHSVYLTVLSQWRGYQHLEWNEQIAIQRQTGTKDTVSLETFARHVAKKVKKFMEVIFDPARQHFPRKLMSGPSPGCDERDL